MSRAIVAILSALVVALAMPAAPVLAASDAKVVIVVGPTGTGTAHRKSDGDEIAVEARKYTSNVIKIYSPNATWARVKAAAQGASVLVYMGHGNGWPSIYSPFQMLTKDGMGLDPASGADSTRTVYYGEQYIRDEIRLAPNAVVLLYHLCYASGNTEPGLAAGTFAQARERVDNYGAGFIGAGARAVIVQGHPVHPHVDDIRQLFTTSRTMEQIFKAGASRNGHWFGPYASQRTPGLTFLMDPESTAPALFYRSIIGDLQLTATAVTGPRPVDTGLTPPEFVVPGAAEVAGLDGTGLYSSDIAAADPAGVPAAALATATHLRLTGEAAPMADGTRVFAASVLGTSTAGFVRADQLAPRDSADTTVLTLDQSSGWHSPNGDGRIDQLVVSARLSEVATTSMVVKNAAGTTQWTATIVGDIARFAWTLKTSAGAVVPDGTYGWTLRAHDGWGNATVTRTGTFTVDSTPPASTATTTATTGGSGWSVSAATLTLAASDASSGVSARQWRVDGGAVSAYSAPATVAGSGVRLVEYRAVDRAGMVEPWHSLTLRIDVDGPVIALPLLGTAGDAAGVWRGPVTVTPAVGDPASGVASKTVSIDGGPASALGSSPVIVATEGPHTVTVAATDLAGNASSRSTTFLVDTTAPVITLSAAPGEATVPTVSPNGDGTGETIGIPVDVTEAGTLTAVVADAGGAVVRTASSAVAAGAATAVLDGRATGGAPLPDGRYSVTLTVRDVAGNVSGSVGAELDVYAALSLVTRTPAIFFPQDGDALSRASSVKFTLLAPATVSVDVINAAGAVVRSAWTDRAMAAGAAQWAWDGRLVDGTWAPRGSYRFVVRAGNGTQSNTIASAWVVADAFRVTTSSATPTRGRAITVTAVTAETLSTIPVLVVRQPGVSTWTVRMTRVNASTWRAVITPKAAGTPGTISLTVSARDSAGGLNSRVVRLPLS